MSRWMALILVKKVELPYLEDGKYENSFTSTENICKLSLLK